MKADWKPSWIAEIRVPAFAHVNEEGPYLDVNSYGEQKYLWGDVPALDLLNLHQNEGIGLTKGLRLLFAGDPLSSHASPFTDARKASGDMRNLVKSLIGLPKTYPGSCEIILNDDDADIVARNAILLLVAFRFEPEVATPLMLHVWYSALIPADMLHSLQNEILPLIKEVCTRIQAKPAQALLSETWTFGTRSLRLVLTKIQWDRLPSYLEVPNGLCMAGAQTIRALKTSPPAMKDYVDRVLLKKPPAWRACAMKFRRDGLLCPFGSSREEFDTPNP